jgi:hypothetical protein
MSEPGQGSLCDRVSCIPSSVRVPRSRPAHCLDSRLQRPTSIWTRRQRGLWVRLFLSFSFSFYLLSLDGACLPRNETIQNRRLRYRTGREYDFWMPAEDESLRSTPNAEQGPASGVYITTTVAIIQYTIHNTQYDSLC